MSFDYFKARWSRIFADAGLPVKGGDKIFYPYVNRKWESATRAVVGFSKEDPNFQGTRAVVASHLRLGTLFKNIPVIEAYAYVPRTTVDVAAALIERYGLPLQADWFVSTPITDEQVNNMPFDIELSLKNVNWCQHNNASDTITVTVYEPNVDVKDAFGTNILDVLSLPYTVKAGATNVELLSIGVDFTPLYPEDYDRLLEIASDNDLYSAATPYVYRSDVLIRLMQERTGIVTKREADWGKNVISTYQAKFVYNGPTAGFAYADTRYDRVLVFDINHNATAYSGRYYFHYNDLY